MRLALPTFILISYILLSLIVWLPCRPWIKIVASSGLCAIGLKYIIYEKIGGSFIAPNFPPAVLLTLEFFYSALVILAFLLMVKDSLILILFISRMLGSNWSLPFTTSVQATGLVSLALMLSLYGTWQSIRVPPVKAVEIPIFGLPQELDGFSLVQLSDLHIGLILKGNWLSQVVARTNALKPDLIVLTGDMIDGPPLALKMDIAALRHLQAKYGVYGITGNHEYYFGVKDLLTAFEGLGITMLHNQYHRFSIKGKNLILAGMPDQAALRSREVGPNRSFLQTLPEGTRILLKHRPAKVEKGIDLQLSGHTHGGHLFFLKWLIGSYNGRLVGGLYDFSGAKLYISPGTGVWAGFSCRLGVPSEISHIILRRL